MALCGLSITNKYFVEDVFYCTEWKLALVKVHWFKELLFQCLILSDHCSHVLPLLLSSCSGYMSKTWGSPKSVHNQIPHVLLDYLPLKACELTPHSRKCLDKQRDKRDVYTTYTYLASRYNYRIIGMKCKCEDDFLIACAGSALSVDRK